MSTSSLSLLWFYTFFYLSFSSYDFFFYCFVEGFLSVVMYKADNELDDGIHIISQGWRRSSPNSDPYRFAEVLRSGFELGQFDS